MLPVSPRPRISLVVHDFSEGFGQGRYCTELVSRLGDRFEFSVVSASFCSSARPSVKWYPVNSWRRGALSTILTFLVRGPAEVRRSVPDLIHSQGMTCWGADLVTAHVCNAARKTQLDADHFRARWFSRIITPLEHAFYRQQKLCRVIGISRIVASEIRDHYGWRGMMDVVHHGTDVDRFRPAQMDESSKMRRQLGLSESAWIWLFMGEANKGLAEVLDQMPLFPEARLVVVSRSDLAPFRANAQRLGVAGRIVFHGPEKAPERLHRIADVFIYPSRYDTFGLVVTEAMASGVPVVVGRNIGAAELIEDGRNGLLCDPTDAPSITRAIRSLATDRTSARAIGREGRRTVERHTWAECAEATARVYDQVLAAKRTRFHR